MTNVLTDFNPNKCCGCLACAAACPTGALSAAEDPFGFAVPGIDETKCVDCGKCISVCPYGENNPARNEPMAVYAAVNLKEEELLNSSSGGVFSVVARKVLEAGGVVFGATMDADQRVFHRSITSVSEIPLLQKSKYVQSDLRDTFLEAKQALKNETEVLFVGTPCQITALYAFLGARPDHLTTIDLVCHGVPSQSFFSDYIAFFRTKHRNMTKYTFRAKKRVNNGMNWYFSWSDSGRTRIRNWPEDSFCYYYMMGHIYRDSCYDCGFAKRERASDLTLCDFWNWERKHAAGFDKNAVVSGVVVNSETGLALVESIRDELQIVESDYEFLSKNNSCLIRGVSRSSIRDGLLAEWKKSGYKAIDRAFRKSHIVIRAKARILVLLPETVKHLRGK